MHSLLVSCQRNLRHSIEENGNFCTRGQGREAGMHSLLVSCQRNLRHSTAENGNFCTRGQGREAGMHCLLVSCQRKLRHSTEENGNFAPGTGQGGRHTQFAGVLPEKPETQYSRKMVTILHRGQGREAGIHCLLVFFYCNRE
jgi:hypothetical protein